MMRQQIMNHIKYCEVCQLSRSTSKNVEKCPHKMHPVSVPQEIWCKIGMTMENSSLLNAVKINEVLFFKYLGESRM